MPVSSSNERVAARCRLDPTYRAKEPLPHASGQQRTGDFGGPAPQLVDQTRLWKFVAALGHCTQAVVWKPIFIAVDPHEILQRERDPRLLVGFELGQVHDQVRGEHGLRQQILVAPVAVVFRSGGRIVVGAAKPIGIEARALKEARAAEIDRAIARRVSGQLLAFGDDPPVEHHCLPAQVDDLELAPQALDIGHEFVEARERANAIKVTVLLRGLGDDHAAFGTRGQESVVHHGAQHGAVGDHALHSSIIATERVPMADEVGLQGDDCTGSHEIAQWVPARVAVVVAIESERVKGIAHRGVDVVEPAGVGAGGSRPREFRVVSTRCKGRRESPIGWLGMHETDANQNPSRRPARPWRAISRSRSRLAARSGALCRGESIVSADRDILIDIPVGSKSRFRLQRLAPMCNWAASVAKFIANKGTLRLP